MPPSRSRTRIRSWRRRISKVTAIIRCWRCAITPAGSRWPGCCAAARRAATPPRCPRTTSHVGRCTPWRVGWAGGLAVGLWHGRGGVGGGVVVFHAPAGTVDGDDVAVVEEAVEDGGGEDLVGEDLAPFAEGLVAGDDDGALLVAAGDDLEDEVGVVAGQGEVAGFVDDQDGGAQVAAELAAEVAGGVGGAELADHV